MNKMLALLPLALATTIPAVPAHAHDGSAIYHYVRSNTDGSKRENIVHYFPAPGEVSVYKWVSKCTTAAYVTGFMDDDIREAKRLVAGKVGEDGNQAIFGDLVLDDVARTLTITIDLGPMHVEETIDAGTDPWFLFDYDMADLNTMFRAHHDGGDFDAGMRLIWTKEPPFFRSMGKVHFEDQGVATDDAGRARRTYAVTGDDALEGNILLDAEDGTIVSATFNRPNHAGYDDFALDLIQVKPGGKAAWDALIRDHYEGCVDITP